MSRHAAAAWQVVKTMPTTMGEVGVFDLHPGVILTIGRGAELPEIGRVDHKYISRAHATIRLTTDPITGAPRVVVQQLGRNPTLIGPSATRLGPHGAGLTSTFDISTDVGGAASRAYRHAHDIGLTTLHFPAELAFPMFHILCVAPTTTAPPSVVDVVAPSSGDDESAVQRDATLVVSSASPPAAAAVTRMMTVPIVNIDSDDDDVQPPPARQTKLLDEALRQQAIANAAETNRASETASWVPPKVVEAVTPSIKVDAPATRRTPTIPMSDSATPVVGTAAPPLMRRPAPPAVAAPAHPQPAGRTSINSETSLAAQYLPAAPPPIAAAPPKAPIAQAPPSTVVHGMGMWEWKCHVDGDEKDPKSWRKYPKATADVLEAAYRKDGGKQGTVAIDATYKVCFDDSRIGMAQYRADDAARWRAVRRRGGDSVHRPKAKKAAILRDTGLTSSSSSDDDDSDDDDDRPDWIVSDSDDSSLSDDSDESDVSFDTESSIETESSDRRKKMKKKGPVKGKGNVKKRPRED